MTDTPETPETGGSVSAETVMEIAHHIAGGSVADRTGDLMRAAVDFAHREQRVAVLSLSDPRDGTDALAYVDGAGVHVIDPKNLDAYRENPVARIGTVKATRLDSFIAITNRFKAGHSAVFARDDMANPALTTVFDYHPANDGPIEDFSNWAMWQRHRASYAFPLSAEWKAWLGRDSKPMTMIEFAAFLEDHIIDVSADPVTTLAAEAQRFVEANRGNLASPSKLIELSRGLQVYESAVVTEAVNLASGEGQIKFQSEHRDADGKPLTVPNMFVITIPVFARSPDYYRLIARLRYRKTGDGLRFWYELWRADLVFEKAFEEACDKVREETGLPLYVGAPEA